MASSEIHLNDIGTQIIVTVRNEEDAIVDISTAITKQFFFKKPDETTATKTATLYTDGTDGKMYYATESGFLNQVGTWKIQGYVAVGSSEFYTDTIRFKVYRNIEEG